MFEFFRRKRPDLAPDEPIQITVSIEIERTPAEVYALLDFADPRNQMVARGNTVEPIGSQPGAYRLLYDLAPDLDFLLTETEAIPGRRYAYSADIVPPVGRREGSHEDYVLEPRGEAGCQVTFVNTVRHVPGLTVCELAEEVGLSSLAAANGLTKLKLLAEEGAEAVAEFERDQGQRE